MKFKKIEKEIIYLLAIKQLIEEMVNFEILTLLDGDAGSSILFKTMTHQKFFNIMLVDLLSCPDTTILGDKKPYLRALTSICADPHFNHNNSIENLKISTENFIDWLNEQFTVEKIWLPSINLKTDLSIKRIEFIKICGNISKHNFSRLSGVTKEIIAIFNRNNIPLKNEDALFILEDFHEWFHTDIFAYHSSTIAEFLNNIRWGIYEYLLPEYQQSIVFESNQHPRPYNYTYPNEVNNRFAKSCYCGLMNKIRAKPYMNKFKVPKYLKMRH